MKYMVLCEGWQVRDNDGKGAIIQYDDWKDAEKACDQYRLNNPCAYKYMVAPYNEIRPYDQDKARGR